MEWYFGNEVDDLLVPKNHDHSEKLSSLDNWSQWGISPFRKNFLAGTNMTRGELHFDEGKSIYNDDLTPQRQNSVYSSVCNGLYNDGGTLLWNDQADYQRFADEQARISQMDDIFFRSLLEEDPTKDSTESPAGYVNIFNGEVLDSPNMPSHGQSLNWENGEVSSSRPMSEQYASEENTMEGSVLQELERVTAQFTAKTRICFRDALYRLAKNSKQTVHSSQDGEAMPISNDDAARVGEMEASESETNAIDRAIANLMFNNIVYEHEKDGNFEQQQQQQHLAGDAEVPIFGQQGLLQPTVNLSAY